MLRLAFTYKTSICYHTVVVIIIIIAQLKPIFFCFRCWVEAHYLLPLAKSGNNGFSSGSVCKKKNELLASQYLEVEPVQFIFSPIQIV